MTGITDGQQVTVTVGSGGGNGSAGMVSHMGLLAFDGLVEAVPPRVTISLTNQMDTISKNVVGLPYRINNLDVKVTELCGKINDLLIKMETKYQTKEMFDASMEKRDDKIKMLEKNYDRLFWGIFACFLYVLWSLLQKLILNINF